MFVRANHLLPGQDKFKQYLTSLNEATSLTINIPDEGGGLKAQGYTQDISGLHRDLIADDQPDSPLGSQFAAAPDSPPGFWGTPKSSQDKDDEGENSEADEADDDGGEN